LLPVHSFEKVRRNLRTDLIEAPGIIVEIQHQNQTAVRIPLHLRDMHFFELLHDFSPTAGHVKYLNSVL